MDPATVPKTMANDAADSVRNMSGSSERASMTPPSSDEKAMHVSAQHDEAAGAAPPRDITGWRWAVVILAILSTQFLFALDNTIVANVQPVIVEEFAAVSKLSWISVAFLIGAASTHQIWGKVYDQFNSKWLYILCILLFEAGSALCGAAPTIEAFIVGRAICGFTGAGMYVGLMAMIATTTTIQERPAYLGLSGLTWGVGTVLGPIIGGAFTDSAAGWRWSFYINLVIGAVFAPVYVFMLPNRDPRPGASLGQRAVELDYFGTLLTLGAFISGVMAISFGGVDYAWKSGTIIGLFCCSGVLFLLLGLQQSFTIMTTVSRRIFPVEFFKSRTILVMFAAMASGGTSLFLPVYYIPLFFQFTRGDSALESGVRLLPFILLLIFSVILNGGLMAKLGYYMPWYTAGGALVLVGSALMVTVDASTSAAHIYGYTVIIGFGAGLFAQASFAVAQAVTAPAMVGAAVGFIACAQISGITLALAIANAVFHNGAQTGIGRILPGMSATDVQDLIAGARSVIFQGLSTEMQEQVMDAIVSAQQKVYILMVTAGALTLVLSLLMKREKLFTR